MLDKLGWKKYFGRKRESSAVPRPTYERPAGTTAVEDRQVEQFSADAATSLIGPLYGLPPPEVDDSELEERVQSAGRPSESYRGQDRTTVLDSLALGALWNARVPLHRLPEELLALVFAFATDYQPPRKPLFAQNQTVGIRLARVCRYWRAIIFTHERFWTTAIVRQRTEWLRLSLSRASNVPLQLEFHHLPTLESVLDDIVPQCHRIRSLVVAHDVLDLVELNSPPGYTQHSLDALYWIVENPFPLLAELEITYLSRPISERLCIVPDNYPRLTKLNLDQMFLPWSTPLLSRLTELTLRGGCRLSHPQLTFDAFLDVLENGMQLEKLVLEGFIGAACHVHPSKRSRSLIVLPHLRLLHIIESLGWVDAFTDSVQLPDCGSVTLHGRCQEGDFDGTPVSLRRLLSRQGDRIRREFSGCGPLFVTSCYGPFLQLSMDSPFNLVLQLSQIPHFRRDDVFTSITDVFEPSALTHLDLSLDIFQTTRSVLDVFFDSVPSLVSLRLKQMPPPYSQELATAFIPTDLLDALSVMSSGNLRCPNLTALRLGPYDWHKGRLADDLHSFLCVRSGLGAPPLQELELTVRWEEKARKMAKAAKYCRGLEAMVCVKFVLTFTDRWGCTLE
ncbi:hypothetical protein C8Q77DRAFT_1227058 [Trametes polyzona]|nr:hypothetical protein C8Q77DRAFT_1227058 [Trametes polyzona]